MLTNFANLDYDLRYKRNKLRQAPAVPIRIRLSLLRLFERGPNDPPVVPT